MRAFIGLLFLGACTQEGPGIRVLTPELAAAPASVEFGDVAIPLSSTLPVFLENAGRADLEVTAAFGGPTDNFVLSGDTFTLAPGEEQVLDITFTPATFKDYTVQLRLDSNDADKPVHWIPVRGAGADLPLPDIAISPSQTIESMGVDNLEEDMLIFEIVNEGGSTLSIEGVRLEGGPEFSLFTDPTGEQISPDDPKAVLVQYVPTDQEGDVADLFIASNDPDEPEVMVRLVGNGGGDFGRPEAVIDCPEEVLITGPENVTFDGSGSTDPNNFYPLVHQWRVIGRPAASDADIPLDPDNTPQIDLYVDVGGTWELELVVYNIIGTASEPVTCQFGAIPEDALHVELSWDTPTADVDLHLARGGFEFFDEDNDCSWCNENPDWGAGGPTDDPRLDIDDLGGFGPENINIEDPEDGTYDVRVHFFKENYDEVLTATIRVWLYGTEVWVGQRVMLHNEVWDVGTIDMPSALFIPQTVPNYTAPRRDCF